MLTPWVYLLLSYLLPPKMDGIIGENDLMLQQRHPELHINEHFGI